MSEQKTVDLYEMLPALYRIRDAERGYPLRAFLEIIGTQVDITKQNIDELWDDLFIETCADWVIPYIGDLIGNNPLHDIADNRRADVAKTIYYRRRKGTLPMLEELARDVTGWGAHAVAFFDLLGWTQNLNHLRDAAAPNAEHREPNAVSRVGSVNLRDLDRLDLLHGPFDVISHTADVRPTSCVAGWHSIRKVGFFLWRLENYPLSGCPPRQAVDPKHSYGYCFSPLRNPTPLFTKPRREAEETGLAGEIHVPGPIRPLALHFDLENARKAATSGQKAQSDYVGPDQSFAIKIVKTDGTTSKERFIPPEAIVCMDLEEWRQPENLTSIQVGVDVQRGRFVFAKGQEPKINERVEVSYNYGFSGGIGGGPYHRTRSGAGSSLNPIKIDVAKGTDIDTIQKALAKWKNKSQPCVIRITDNGVYGGDLDIQLSRGSWLTIEAAAGVRPVVRLVGTTDMSSDKPIAASGDDAILTVSGLLIEGSFKLSGNLTLNIHHCTLVPGRTLNETGAPKFPDRDSLTVKTGASAPGSVKVTIGHSIVGPIRLPAEGARLTIRDSIVQAPKVKGKARAAIAANDSGTKPGPPTTLERVTVWGSVHVKELTLASEVIFTSQVKVQHRQAGCVRFSHVPKNSQTPRRYRCQPDMALEAWAKKRAEKFNKAFAKKLPQAEEASIRSRLQPSFTSTRYGDLGFAQLDTTCAQEIRTGAEDGSEMGAFCSLKQPQRETNLRIRLEEYLPFGLEAGLIYVT